MASDSEGVAAAMNLTNSRLSTLNGQTVEDHKLSPRRSFLVLDQRSQAGTSQAGTSKAEAPAFIDTMPTRNFSSAPVILEIGSRLRIIQTDASDGSVPAA